MFANLCQAHDISKESLRERNDEILERIYIRRRCKNDTVRNSVPVGKTPQKLFKLYTKMTTQQKLAKDKIKP